MPKPKKKGRASQKEIALIAESAKNKTVEQIADDLGRTVEWVKGHMKQDDDATAANEILVRFRASPDYKSLHRKFDEQQIAAFESKYVRMLKQFKEDVLYTEESQIFMLITYELLIDKNMIEMKEMDDQIKELVEQVEELREEIDNASDGVKKRDLTSSLQNLNGHVVNLRIARARLNKVVDDFVKNMSKQWELIKGTRKDRITVIENSKKTFIDMLKSFENNKFRADEGREMELMRIAGVREKERLGAKHVYMDGLVDRPLLSADTIGEEERDERTVEVLQEKDDDGTGTEA